MQSNVCQGCGVMSEARFCTGCGRPFGNYYAASPAADAPFTRFSRPRQGRMLAGVCAALSRHYGWDVTLVRLAAVLLLLASFGATLIGYVAAWIIMPVDADWVVAQQSAASAPAPSVSAS